MMHSDQSASFFMERYLSEKRSSLRYEIVKQDAHNSKLSISVDRDKIISLYLELIDFIVVLFVYLFVHPLSV